MHSGRERLHCLEEGEGSFPHLPPQSPAEQSVERLRGGEVQSSYFEGLLQATWVREGQGGSPPLAGQEGSGLVLQGPAAPLPGGRSEGFNSLCHLAP